MFSTCAVFSLACMGNFYNSLLSRGWEIFLHNLRNLVAQKGHLSWILNRPLQSCVQSASGMRLLVVSCMLLLFRWNIKAHVEQIKASFSRVSSSGSGNSLATQAQLGDVAVSGSDHHRKRIGIFLLVEGLAFNLFFKNKVQHLWSTMKPGSINRGLPTFREKTSDAFCLGVLPFKTLS